MNIEPYREREESEQKLSDGQGPAGEVGSRVRTNEESCKALTARAFCHSQDFRVLTELLGIAHFPWIN